MENDTLSIVPIFAQGLVLVASLVCAHRMWPRRKPERWDDVTPPLLPSARAKVRRTLPCRICGAQPGDRCDARFHA